MKINILLLIYVPFLLLLFVFIYIMFEGQREITDSQYQDVISIRKILNTPISSVNSNFIFKIYIYSRSPFTLPQTLYVSIPYEDSKKLSDIIYNELNNYSIISNDKLRYINSEIIIFSDIIYFSHP